MGLFGGGKDTLGGDQAVRLVSTATQAMLRAYVRERRWPDRAAVGRMLMAAEMETGIKLPWSSRARAIESVAEAGKLLAPDAKAMRELEDLLAERPDIIRYEMDKVAKKAAEKKHLIKVEKV